MRKILFICGFICALEALIVIFIMGLSFGNMLPMGIGLFLILWGSFYKNIRQRTEKGILKILKYTVAIGLLFFFVSLVALSVFLYTNAKDTKKYDADYVIILGTGLKGDKVTPSLVNRLKTGYEYFINSTNDNVKIIVSGGQGRDEWVTESYAMKQYLISMGADPSRIIEEDRSHNTYENFVFSKSIMDNMQSSYSTVFVTNDFHVYRSTLNAKKAGFTTIEQLSAKSPLYLVPTLYIREYFSFIKYLLL